MYSPLKRRAELDFLPLARNEELAVLPYSPAAAGLLTAWYGGGTIPAQSRLTSRPKCRERYGEDWMPGPKPGVASR